MGNNVIEVARLSKSFAEVEAVRDVSFSVASGELFGLLGPNGAGKSTTIKILATLQRPGGGQAIVNGHDVMRNPTEVRRSIGIVFQEPSLDIRLSVRENLSFHARIYGMLRRAAERRINEALELAGLTERAEDPVRQLSGGLRRRLEIVRGVLHQPAVLILDEPTTGLDPRAREDIWQHIAQLRKAQGVTVLLTTHYMDEAEPCDRVAIMDKGKLIALGSPSELKNRLGGEIVETRQPTLHDVYLKMTTN